MDEWKQSFSQKLNRLRSSWVAQFDKALDDAAVPVFDELGNFLRENGFRTSMPLREKGRRSFKFELAEDAYVLMIFRSVGMGAFELSCETFVPGGEPESRKGTERIAELNKVWALKKFQTSLNAFIEKLGRVASPVKAPEEEPVPA